MSHYVVLHSWAGDDADKAAFRLATMFALPQKEAGQIVQQVQSGAPWQFDQVLDDKNAETVNRYLSTQGFGIELIPADGTAQAEAVDEEAELEAEDLSAEPVDDLAVEPAESVDPAPPAAQPKPLKPAQGGPVTTLNVEFRGLGGELFKIMFVNWILTIITLGIYYFWGKTRVRRYIWENSSFNRDFFHYHGTGGELFRGFLIFFGLLFLLTLGLGFLAQGKDPIAQKAIESSISGFFILLLPALMVGAYRYRFSRTSLRNIRFGFDGSRLRATFIYIFGYLLTMFTLTFYLPFYLVRLKKFWVENSRFGNKHFEYSGRGRDIMKPYLVTLLVMIVIPIFIAYMKTTDLSKYPWIPFTIFFIYIMGYFWWSAFLARYHWAHTHFAGGAFQFTATGWNLFFLKFTNAILVLVTLGLGYPWAVIRERNFFAHHLSCEGTINMNHIVQEMQKSGAISEGGADVFDVPLDFG